MSRLPEPTIAWPSPEDITRYLAETMTRLTGWLENVAPAGALSRATQGDAGVATPFTQQGMPSEGGALHDQNTMTGLIVLPLLESAKPWLMSSRA
jgi:hypothetical protein